MPKKRFTTQYSKPQSTVHPSLSSATSSRSSGHQNDGEPTVNELISSLRTSNISATPTASSATVATPTLPPQIRHLLAQPETPAPRPRVRNWRHHSPVPFAGPPPPRSWLVDRLGDAPASISSHDKYRVLPTDVGHLPGLDDGMGKTRSLRDMCLRNMAREWEYVREYERYNLADLPSPLRMALLSVIPVHGPINGVGFEGLKTILVLPESDEHDLFDVADSNDSLFRLDLSGAMGDSISFKELTDIVRKPSPEEAIGDMSWEESIPRSLSAIIPTLTHLSLSHPSSSVSWKSLLSFSKHVPILTHLSLAFWPVPTLLPNSKTAVMSIPYGKDVQYGGQNYYSHSLDFDFSEASGILKKLADMLYGLQYLDITGCGSWVSAFHWSVVAKETGRGLDLNRQWLKLHTLKLFSGIRLSDGMSTSDLKLFIYTFREAIETQEIINCLMNPRLRSADSKRKWVDVARDDLNPYKRFNLWHTSSRADNYKRAAFGLLEKMEETIVLPTTAKHDDEDHSSHYNRIRQRLVLANRMAPELRGVEGLRYGLREGPEIDRLQIQRLNAWDLQ